MRRQLLSLLKIAGPGDRDGEMGLADPCAAVGGLDQLRIAVVNGSELAPAQD